jgi:SAM-dependent methyltransferase
LNRDHAASRRSRPPDRSRPTRRRARRCGAGGRTIDRLTCPVCSSHDLRDLGALGHRRLAACRGCAHHFVSRCDDAALAAEYRAAYYTGADDPRIAAWAAAHVPVWNALVDQVLRLQPTVQSLLDIGAGTGGFLSRLRARRPDVALAAVEASAAARAALAHAFPGIGLPADDAERLDAGGGTFDVITMLQTLEHLHEPLAACRGARLCLRPGGLLLVAVPNRKSLAVLARGRVADCYANGTHLQFFDATTVVRLLGAAGFGRIERLIGFGGGQHTAWLPNFAQYAARVLGWSTELRFVARP